MAPPVKRRHTPIEHAKKILEAIGAIKKKRLVPNFERIARYCQRFPDLNARSVKEHINNAISDGFIVEFTTTGLKGARCGMEQEGYRVPLPGEVEEINDGHDWYCFECHMPGEVYECSTCFRVYHQGCTREDTTGEIFICSVCRDKEMCKKRNKMKRRMLNTLLSYTIVHLREWTRELNKIGLKSNADDFKRYVFKRMDLNRMEKKVQANRYKCLDEFHADARVILHNCILVFNDNEIKGGMVDLAIYMVNACKYDIDEIELCPNCYYMSNAKPEDWFSQPCNPPHDLVFAKQKGYCYWPAKVVRDLGGKYDVRFFGGWHQRAVIPAEYIKPIETEIKTMSIKKTQGFNKAIKELKIHQKLLEERAKEREAADFKEPEVEEEEEEEELEDEVEEEEVEEYEQYEEAASVGKSEKDVDDFSESKDDISMNDEDGNMMEVSEVTKNTFKKKAAKRKRESSQSLATPKKSTKKPRLDDGEEDYDRQVTSTSVEKNSSKRKRKSTKNNSHDESYTVTSSGDHKDMQNFPSPTPGTPTVSTSSQTILQNLHSVGTQTTKIDNVEEPKHTDEADEKNNDIVNTDAKKQEVSSSDLQKQIDFEEQQAKSDEMWEERMTKAMADLTKRLEEKFEEDKSEALKELSQRLEGDFGKDKQQAVERAIANMKQEIEKARKAGEDKAREQYMEEMKKLAAMHKDTISQTKKKQWCQYCEDEAIYHCCWNTSYCSTECQLGHWHREHKKYCRRKKTTNTSS